MTRLALLTSLLAAGSAMAHCQLAWPFPLHSPLNPATPEAIKDYSNTSPLTAGQYPCKGYINNPSSDMFSVASFAAGSSINYTVAGTATHGGGSCQVSMSYDNGATWNVILSQVGGCLVDGMTTDVTIPADAPSGEALFAWGWFNLLGNREMYHNCAVVTITNGGSGLNENDYPTPFVANAGNNDCVTIENTEVVFPNPGKNVRYGGRYASSKPTTPAGYTGSNCVGPGATESTPSIGGSASSAPAEPSATTSADSADVSIGVGISIGVSATSPSPASPENTGTATLSNANNAADPVTSASASASASVPTSTDVKACKRRSRRSKLSSEGMGRRHERLIRRPRSDGVKRVAASKAEHLNRAGRRAALGGDGVRRVAAMMATHNV